MSYQAEYHGVVEQRTPWYLNRSCPIFCRPCVGIYQAIYPARKIVLLMGTGLWILGFVFVLAAILACIAGVCSAVVAGLCPVGILLMFVGYGLFHCAWAAYLLDEPGETIMENRTNNWEAPRERSHTPPRKYEEQFETAYEEQQTNPQRAGHWQFVEEPAWQSVATRDRLQ